MKFSKVTDVISGHTHRPVEKEVLMQFLLLIGIFSVASILMGFLFMVSYRQGARLSRGEATVEAQKEEIRFLKELIIKLLPPLIHKNDFVNTC